MSGRNLPENAVAIVGIACRFPGAKDLGQFWENLREGRESITFFTPEELDKTLRPEVVKKANYVRAKGKLEDADKFDASFFGVSPAEASIMDPQQRLLLELSWASLEDAGIVPGEDDRLIGVWVGTNWNRYYAKHVRGSAVERRYGEFNAQLANEADFPATRISYKLNLTGPSVSLATACSTSLVALGQAVQSLLNYECNAALAGGVSVSVPINAGYQYQEGSMLSADGHCRPFDAAATGTTFNDGAGVVTLKRLEDAVRDDDDIYAVVRGVGINNDGADKVSFTAPGVSGQIAALESALAIADVDPASVGFIEAHGTATPLGDPIEVSAIRQVYGADGRGVPCALGSLKSNIGHAIHAAGIAGVIKAALCVREGVIPATLHFENPNPELNLDEGRFFVNNERIAWECAGPRRAAVSSFGVGGTNAHAIIEEPPARPAREPAQDSIPLALLSAKDTDTVVRHVGNLVRFAAGRGNDRLLGDLGYTLAHRRARFDSRAALFARSTAGLGKTNVDGNRIVRGKARELSKLVWAFPGQGAQVPGMGSGLIASSKTYADALARCIAIANRYLDIDLGELIARIDSDDQRISQTVYTQPALFAVGFALAKHYEALGIKPDVQIGHSIGEFVAACLAGVFNLEDAMSVVCERGRLMQAQPPGSMLSVLAPPSSLKRYVTEDICIAVQNGPEICVLAGPTGRLEEIAEDLRADEVRVKMLNTSHAFHSPMMDGALPEFREIVERTERHPPEIPIVSTSTGKLMSAAEAVSSDYWVNQLRNPVRLSDAIDTLVANAGNSGLAMLELGPGRTLASLFLQQSGPDHAAASALSFDAGDDEASAWLALGALWTAGFELPLDAWWDGNHHKSCRLPTYPFRRDVHWIEASASAPPAAEAEEQDKTDEPADLRSQVIALFRETTGLDLIASDGAKPFSEIGLDSLLLTQIAVALQDEFDVMITIKDLVNDVNTVDLAFKRIEAQIPQVRKGVKARSAAASGRAAEAGVPVQAHLSRGARKRKQPGLRRRDTRPHSVSQWSELGQQRSSALRAFVEAHAKKTAGSRAHIARHRVAHADPRTASGFHRVWKQIVYPLVCIKSEGAELWDVDNNRYIDMLSGFGPNLLGHANPVITEAITRQLQSGMEIGPQSGLAGETASLVCQLTGMDRASFVCTGSEAVQAALRCARTFTRRSKIVVFEGAYHGNFDEVLVRSANTPGYLRSIPGSPGIPRGSVADVIVLPWNDPSSLAVVDEIGDQLAAVMVEPVQSRKPEVQPGAFLKSLREITADHGALLIFDEVVTGFRCHPGGAQAYFGVEADLATYGKVAGGNMPIGIVAGREQIMNTFDGGPWAYGDDSMPNASVTFFAGTFVRHPLAIAACHAMLAHLIAEGPQLQSRLSKRAGRFVDEINGLFESFEAPFELLNFTSVMYLRNNDVSELGSLFWYYLRHNGIFALEGFPSYLTVAHEDRHLAEVVSGVRRSLESMVEAGLLLEPRNLNREIKLAAQLPEHPPIEGARLGEDPLGTPGWFIRDNESYLGVPGGLKVDFDPFARGELARVIPASESQQEVWLAAQLGDDASCAFNESVSIRLSGVVDVAALEAALNDVVERHAAMRATLTPDGLLLKIRDASLHRINCLSAAEKPLSEFVAEDVAAPFDLVNGPLFRFTLVSTDDTEHTLVLTVHHIVCDGWSTYLILKELGNRYRARCELDAEPLPPADDLASYNRAAADLAHTEAEDYWLDEFQVVPPVLDFPADKARPALRTFASERLDKRVAAQRLGSYKSLASDSNASLFAVLLSGWIAYVARITEARDIVIGIPSAGQAGAGVPNLVGHCVNLLPIRIQVDVQASFATLLEHLREKMTEALTYQDYTFGRLLKRLPLPRDPSRLPLIPIQFNLDPPISPGTINFGDAVAEVSTNPRRFENFEIFINIAEIDGELDMQTQFNCNLFHQASIDQRLDEYLTLLDGAVLAPETKVAHLQLLSQRQRDRLLALGQGPQAEFSSDVHFLEGFADQVRHHPQAVAARSGGQRLSYQELDDLSSRLAACLIDQVGDVKGSMIGVAMPRGVEMLASLLAVWKVGAAYVPLDPEFPEARLDFMIEDAAIKFVISSSVVELTWREDINVLALDRLNLSSYEPYAYSRALPVDTRAYVIYTSGSTGLPKGVEVPHRAVSNFLQSMIAHPGLSADDILVAVTTLSFDIAVLELFAPLLTGATTVIAGREQVTDGAALIELLRHSGATVMQATPVTWRMLLEAGWGGSKDFRVLCGGEAFPGDLATDLLACAKSVFNMYGPTETTVWSTVFEIAREQWTSDPEPIVPIGLPIHHTQVHVLDGQQQSLPPGIPGELYIGGDGVALGYLGREGLTAQRFVNHPVWGRLYRTGDKVRQSQRGALRFIERVDSQVKVRGFRIELGEIEACLSSHPTVTEAVVSIYEPSPGDARIAAYCVTKDGEIDAEALRQHVQGHLPQYMVPQYFTALASLPLTPNLKADRKALPAPVTQQQEVVLPRSEAERLVADAYKAILRLERVGVHDDFFMLGGHSLLASQLASRLARDMGIQIPMRALFDAPTVAGLAAWAAERSKAGGAERWTISRRPDRGTAPLSAMQQRLWFLEQLDAGRPVYNTPSAHRLLGKLDEAAFARAFAEMVRRQDVLRTVIAVVDEQPTQIILAEVPVDLLPVEDLRHINDQNREQVLLDRLNTLTALPFDLAEPPLFRAKLFRLADEEYVFFFVVHHIIWDGWSFDLLYHDLAALYGAFRENRPSPLPDLDITYGDFAVWHREWMQSDELAAELAHWKKRLAGPIEPLSLPSDHQRPSLMSGNGKTTWISIPASTVDRMRELGRSADATLFMSLLSAYVLMLHQIAGQREIVVGTPVRGREIVELEPIMGFFVNALPLRIRIGKHPTFAQLLKEVRTCVRDALKHPNVPFEALVRELNVPRDTSRFPIYQAMFSFQDVRQRVLRWGNLDRQRIPVMQEGVAEDIGLWFVELPDGLLGGLSYSTDILSEDTALLLRDRYIHTLKAILANPDAEISLLPPSESERRRLASWNATDLAFNRDGLMHSSFEAQAHRAPTRIALTCRDASITYGELDARANHLAHALRKRGVQRGSLVGICIERGIDMVVAQLAVLKCGSAYVPLDPAYPAERLAFMAEDAALAMVVTDSRLAGLLEWPRDRSIYLDVDAAQIAAQPGTPLTADADAADAARPEDPAYVIYTSGSTGKPKGVQVPHRAVVNFLTSMQREPGLTADDRLVAVTTLSFDIAVLELLLPLSVGAKVVLATREESQDGYALASLIEAGAATVMQATPATWQILLSSGWTGRPGFKALAGGEALAPDLAARLMPVVGEVWNMYGPTETTVWSTCWQIAEPERRICVGSPIANTQVHVINDRGSLCPIGVPGEILIGGDGVTSGYLNRPGLTAEQFTPDPFSRAPGARLYRTGDRGRWRSDATIEHLGRLDYQVKVRGHRVELGEIETGLAAHPSVEEAVVLAREDDPGDVRLVAYYTARDSLDRADLRAHLRNNLPEYMLPQNYVPLEAIPRLPNGKTDRNALPRPDSVATTSVQSEISAPSTESEKMLASIWVQLLKVEDIGTEDNFFDLGGHSLLCMQVIMMMESKTGKRMNPRRFIFETLAQVASGYDQSAPEPAQTAGPIRRFLSRLVARQP